MFDWLMVAVVLSILATPFLPLLLKGKCPACSKRQLESLETVRTALESGRTYVTYYRCHNCDSCFQRENSGPLQPG
jgi:hypothetical protein